MARRFIKLYDQITRWEWYQNGNTLRLFIHLLLKANYAESAIEGLTIRRGQVLTSLPRLSAETGMSVKEIRTALGHLVRTGEAADRPTNKYRVITILKYDEYQVRAVRPAGDGQAEGRQGAGDGHHHKNNTEDKRVLTERGESTEGFTPPTVVEVMQYINGRGLKAKASDFVDYYTSTGWMIGHSPMRDWQAAVRTWARREALGKGEEPESRHGLQPAGLFRGAGTGHHADDDRVRRRLTLRALSCPRAVSFERDAKM